MKEKIDSLGKAVNKIYGLLQDDDERRHWSETAKEIAKYTTPGRYLLDMEQRGKDIGKYIFDATAVNAVRTMTDGLYGHTVSPRSKWFRRKTGIVDPQGRQVDAEPPVAKWLQDVERVEYTTLQQSNFYDAANQFIQDWCDIGLGVMYSEYDMALGVPLFYALHPLRCYISENRHGTVNTLARESWDTLENIVETFDITDKKFLKEAKDNPYDKKKIIHLVCPRTNPHLKNLPATKKEYLSVYILTEKIGDSEYPVLRESGYDLFPYAVSRFRKFSGEVYGKSPVWDILGLIRVVNKLYKAMLMMAQYAADPMYNVPEEMIDQFHKYPGTEFYYKDPQRVVYPADAHSRAYPVAPEVLQDLRDQIKSALRVDFFTMMSQEDKEMTATEINAREGEKATLLGPPISRLMSEALQPMMDLLYQQLVSNGKIPAPPEALAAYGGEELRIDFIGPLAQAQERYLSGQPLRSFLGEAGPWLELDPTGLDNIDIDAVIEELGSSAAIPQKVLRAEAEVIQQRQARAAMQQKMMEAEIADKQASAQRKTAQNTGGNANMAPPAERIKQA